MKPPTTQDNAERLLGILVKQLDKPSNWTNPESLGPVLEHATRLAATLAEGKDIRGELEMLSERVGKAEAVALAAHNEAQQGASAWMHLNASGAVRQVG